MKKTVFFIFSFLFLTSLVWGQTTTTIDFETADEGYTATGAYGSGTTDLFNRTITTIGGNTTYYWAAEDMNAGTFELNIDQIDISSASTFSFSIDFLTPITNQWDSTDELLITYSIDGGAYQNLMWVQHIPDDDFNNPAALDLDFNGDGDAGQELPAISDPYPAGVGSDFETFLTSSVSVSGSTLDITLQFNNLTSGGEGIYLDNIVINTVATGGVIAPTGFSSTVQSTSQINLTWTDNANGDDVLVVFNSDGSFTDPVDGNTYTGSALGGTVIYQGTAEAYNHTSLSANTAYYYKAWSVDGDDNYSSGVTDDATTFKEEPTNHVTGFTAVADGFSKIDLSWTENDGAVVPDGYLIKSSTSDNVSTAVDGIIVTDNPTIGSDSGAINLVHGTVAYEWTGLDAETIYYFKIFPYTNSGLAIDYKTDGTVPSDNATTGVMPDLPEVYFSEYIEGDSNNKALEIFNGTAGTINLNDFAFPSVSNAPTVPGEYEYWNTFTVDATLASGDVYIIAHPSAVQAILDVADMTHLYLSNGDDGYALVWGSETDYIVIDWIGDWDGDPGTGWDVAGTINATADHTLVRKSSVTTGNTDWSSSAGTDVNDSEWEVYDQNTFTFLGDHSGTPLPVNLSAFYALYIGGTPTLYWVTQTETDNAYWNVYRGTNNNFTEAGHLNSGNPVPGNGTTNSASEYVYVDNASVIQNTTYWYWIEDVSLDGETEVHEPITLTIPYEDIPITPDTYGLHQNYPNPFNPSTSISFALSEESDVELIIYNIKGAKIRTIFNDHIYADQVQSVIWDGNDATGKQVSSGVYFYKLITETKEYQKKMLLVK